jgi:Tfp pilus assembly protein PilZ
MDEHRRSERRSALLRVELTEHLDGRAVSVEAVDVAPTGVFLATKRPGRFHHGQTVTLRLYLDGRPDPLVVAGEVVRVVDKADARAHRGRPGIAVEFVTRQEI